MLRFTVAATPLGELTVAWTPSGVVATAFEGDDGEGFVRGLEQRLGTSAERNDRAGAALGREVSAYFAGRPRALRSPVDLALATTPFTRAVLEAAMHVPAGELRTYGDVAAEAGRPRAWRAAGTALRHCPIELWVPCHRIVPSGPGYGTYGGHPERREFLLRLEGAI